MKILYTNFHPRNGGGHVTYILNLVTELMSDHQITVATPGTSRLYRYVGIYAAVKRVDLSFPGRVTEISGPCAALRALVKREQFDVIHVNGSSDHKLVMLATFGLRHKPRIVLTKHNDHPINSIGNLLRSVVATDATIGVSDYITDILQRSPYRKHPIYTIRHGVDINYFSPVMSTEKIQSRERFLGVLARDTILLGSAGGTDDDKGWFDLAHALALLPAPLRARFHVVVIGDPPKKSKLRELDDLGVGQQFSFPGLLDDVRSVLAACDLGFVLSYREALSFACRELMALGLPVLVTRVGGLPENLIDQQQGWVVPAKDPVSIKAVLEQVLEAPSILQTMGTQARTKASCEFNLKCFTAQTLAVYQS